MKERKKFIDDRVLSDFDDDQFFSEMIAEEMLKKGEISKEDKKNLDILRKQMDSCRNADV